MSQRPNVVWVSFEDCSPRFGCYGDPVARTPNLDRLASEGTLWTKAFTTAPVCGSGIIEVITGMHPVTLGTHHMRTNGGSEYANKGIPGYEAVIPHYVRCFPEYLRAAGYFCTNRNKADYQFIAPLSVWDLPGGHWRDRPDPDQPFFAVFNLDDTHEMAGWPGFFDDKDIDIDRIEVPPYFPDTPKVRESLVRVYAAIEHADRLLGVLLDELEEDGLSDTTAVFVWTDHGPLPRGKRWPYDSGIHSPLIVRWPGVIEPGTVSDDLVSTMDLGPTVLSICGAEVPRHLHGRPFPRTRSPWRARLRLHLPRPLRRDVRHREGQPGSAVQVHPPFRPQPALHDVEPLSESPPDHAGDVAAVRGRRAGGPAGAGHGHQAPGRGALRHRGRSP